MGVFEPIYWVLLYRKWEVFHFSFTIVEENFDFQCSQILQNEGFLFSLLVNTSTQVEFLYCNSSAQKDLPRFKKISSFSALKSEMH